MWFRNLFNRDRDEGADGNLEGNLGAQLPARAVHQLNRLHLWSRRELPGSRVGLRRSMRRKPSHDFHEHRAYVPGDDVRYVDWKASARQEHIYIRQGEHPRNITVSLLLDCSASMDWGEPPKSTGALSIAAALAYAVLNHGDRLNVLPLGDEAPQRLGPLSGKGQVPAVLKYLQAIPFGGQLDLVEAVRSFTQQTRGGMVLLLSDLLETGDLRAALELLPAPTWQVVVLHLLHRDELEPQIKGDFQLIDAETGKKANYDVSEAALQEYKESLAAWRNELEMSCVDNHAVYQLLSSESSMAQEIIPALRAAQILVPV